MLLGRPGVERRRRVLTALTQKRCEEVLSSFISLLVDKLSDHTWNTTVSTAALTALSSIAHIYDVLPPTRDVRKSVVAAVIFVLSPTAVITGACRQGGACNRAVHS